MPTLANAPAPPKPVNEYLRQRVMSASPEELRLMLLEGAIKYATQGREGLARKDYEASFNGLSSCRDIVLELLTTIRVDPNPELASQLKGLYTFFYTSLVEAGHEKDLAKLDKVIELLQYERETWILLMQKLAEERTAGDQPRPRLAPGERVPLSIQG
jgi:flagellar protein FliS